MSKDYYKLLEVVPNASPEVISAAFKALSVKFHPDVFAGGSDEPFKAISEAYTVLSNPSSRRKYDRQKDPKGKVIGSYLVEKEIAEGGFGKTYLGRHVTVKEPVCIKHCSNISAIADEVLINEAKSIWDLRHYAIPTMRDLLKLPDGSSALVMSYVEGPTLQQIIEKNKKLDPETVAWITERILNALQYLHYNGVIHGDIKPQNIIIQPEKHMAVIIDFGLAMIKPKGTDKAAGYTELFAPPEQVAGRPLLPESDLYSLGMTMIYSLNGGDIPHSMRREVPSTTTEELQKFFQRLTTRNVLSRPNWQTEDLTKSIISVRKADFGRVASNMKKLDY